MIQSTEKAREGKRGGLKQADTGGNRHKKRVRQPHNTAERQRQKVEIFSINIIMKYFPPQVQMEGEYIMDTRQVHFNLPSDTNGYNNVPGGYQPEAADGRGQAHRPNSIEIQHTNGGWAGPPSRGVRFADEEPVSSRYTSEPIYTPRILRDPETQAGARQHVSDSSDVVVVGNLADPRQSEVSRLDA